MENASKALLIAGGVLIALIILAMLLAMFNSISNIQKEQEEQTKIEQIAAFNSDFEAYTKKVMYGTDVITVMNKDIQNNLNTDSKVLEDRYYININLKIKNTIQTTVERENIYTGRIENFYDFDFIKNNFGYNLSNKKLEKDKIYSLGKFDEDELKMDSSIKELFSSETKDYVCYKGQYRYSIQSVMTNFIKTVFSCTNVEYNEDGRIMEMTFEQK